MLTVAQGSWQYRAIDHCRGNRTQLGTILLAVLGHNAKNPPRYSYEACINAAGLVIAAFENRHGARQFMAVCSVDELTKGFSKLADALKLEDWERIAMFEEVRKWIARDYRVNPTLHFSKGFTGYDRN